MRYLLVTVLLLAMVCSAQADSIMTRPEYRASSDLTLGALDPAKGYLIGGAFQLNLVYQAGIDNSDIDPFNDYTYPTTLNFPDNLTGNYYYLKVDASGGLPIGIWSNDPPQVLSTDSGQDWVQWTLSYWEARFHTILAGDIVDGKYLRALPTVGYRTFPWDQAVNNLEIFAGYPILCQVAGYSYTAPLVAGSTLDVSKAIYVPMDYPTIQAAINAASPGDTIIVSAGTYTEWQTGQGASLVIDKSLHLVGSGDDCVIQGPRSASDSSMGYGNLVKVTAADVEITGFKFSGAAATEAERYGATTYCITANPATGLNVHDNAFTFYGDTCVSAQNSVSGLLFQNNRCLRETRSVWYKPAGATPGSYVDRTRGGAGPGLWSCTDGTVSGNICTPAGVGIFLNSCTGTVVGPNNVVTAATPAPQDEGIHLQSCTNVTVTGNTVSGFTAGPKSGYNQGMKGAGVWIGGGSNNTVQENTLTSNSFGVLLECRADQSTATGMIVLHNDFGGNGYGVFNMRYPISGSWNYIDLSNRVEATADVDATSNWWGTPDGPKPSGHGDRVSTHVIYTSPLGEPYGDNVLYLVPTGESIYVQPGEEVTVTLNQANLATAVNGYQAWLSFDAAKLTTPRNSTLTDTPYDMEILNTIGEGTADLAAGTSVQAGTTDDALLSTLKFTAGSTGTTSVGFRSHNPATMFTDDDGNGVVATLVDSVTIYIDGVDPEITCPDPVSVSAGAGVCEATNVNIGTATATDDLSGVASITNDHPSTTYSIGTTIVTWTATDNAGNTATCQQQVKVTDDEKPDVDKGSIAACYPTEDDAEAAAIAATTATDNCGTPVKTASTVGTCSAVVTVRATDASGNYAEVTYDTRIDNTAPVVTCPANITVYAAAGSSSAVVTWVATANDNCDDALTPTCDPPSGSTFTVAGSPHTVTCTATDTCGNTGSCNFTVTVLPYNQATITVELEGVTTDISRYIKFTFGGTVGTVGPVTLTQSVDFDTAVFDGVLEVGRKGTVTLNNVPAGVTWTRISAKDEQHTLRQQVGLTVVDGVYQALFTGDDHLIGGDMTNDNLVDIRDFGVLSGQYGTSPPLDTQWPVKNANVNCVGTVDTGDFTYVRNHFLSIGDDEPLGASLASLSVGSVSAASVNEPMSSISVKELADIIGMRDAKKADINRDGVVDLTDVKLFMQGQIKRGR